MTLRKQMLAIALTACSVLLFEIAFREDAMITDILQDPETGEPAAWKYENASSWWEAREDYRRDINRLTLRLAGDICEAVGTSAR